MKRLLLFLLFALTTTAAFAQQTGKDGGVLPNLGVEMGGKGADGNFHYFSVDNSGAINTTGTTTATTVVSTALEASHVLKASAGSLRSLVVTNTNSSAQWILVMNSATVPSDGAVALLLPPIRVAGVSTTMVNFSVPLTASAGIAVCDSSTGTFTKTVGAADCIFTGQVQ